jgi:hypothetical protein
MECTSIKHYNTHIPGILIYGNNTTQSIIGFSIFNKHYEIPNKLSKLNTSPIAVICKILHVISFAELRLAAKLMGIVFTGCPAPSDKN